MPPLRWGSEDERPLRHARNCVSSDGGGLGECWAPEVPHVAPLWAQINRRVHRLERIYTGAQGIDNTGELEDEVDALLLCIANLRDWMIADPVVGKSLEQRIRVLTARPDFLGLCREYANTSKHHTYNLSKVVRRYARLSESTSGPSGVAVSLRYWKEDGAGEDQSVDALKSALDCIAEWRSFLAAHGIEDPQPR